MHRLLPRLRKRFPKATIGARLDGGFAAPEVLDFLEPERLEYVIGLGATKPLAEEAAAALMRAVRDTRRPRCGRSENIF